MDLTRWNFRPALCLWHLGKKSIKNLQRKYFVYWEDREFVSYWGKINVKEINPLSRAPLQLLPTLFLYTISYEEYSVSQLLKGQFKTHWLIPYSLAWAALVNVSWVPFAPLILHLEVLRIHTMSYSTWRELTKIFLQKYVWRESKYLYHIHLLFLLFRCGYRINNLHTLVNQLHACSHGQLSAAPWTAVHQVSKSMGFFRQECCSGFPFPTPWDLPNLGIELMSLASLGLAGRFFTTVPSGKPEYINSVQFSSFQFSRSVVSDLLRPHGLQHTRLPIHCQLPELAQTYVHRVGDTSNNLSCHSLLLLPSIFPSIRVFSNESVLHIKWPKYWSFSFSISLSNEYSGLISFRIDWFDPFAVQGTLKSLLQHHSSKTSILWCSAFFMVQLSHPYMTTGKTIA